MEGNALEHPFVGLVSEPYILELNLATDLFQFDGVFFVNDLGHHIKNGEDLFGGGVGTLQHIKLLSQSLDGVEETGNIAKEDGNDFAGDDLTEESGVVDISLGTEIEEAQLCGNKQHVDHGTENAEDIQTVELGFSEGQAALFKIGLLAVFPVENLGDFHAGEIFGKERVDVGVGVADLTVRTAGELPENHSEEHHEGHKAQNHQCQRIVDKQHSSHNADDDQSVFCQSDDDVGEHEADGVGVVADTSHQLADGDVVQLIVGETFDVGEYIQPDLGENLLTGLLQQHGLQVGANQGDHQHACVDDDQLIKLCQLKAVLL